MPRHKPLMTFETDDLTDDLRWLSSIRQPTMTIHCLASRLKNKMIETDAGDTWRAAKMRYAAFFNELYSSTWKRPVQLCFEVSIG